MNRRQVVAELRRRVADLESDHDHERWVLQRRREDRAAVWSALRPTVWSVSLLLAVLAGNVLGTWWPLW